jgi:hypothetical protein
MKHNAVLVLGSTNHFRTMAAEVLLRHRAPRLTVVSAGTAPVQGAATQMHPAGAAALRRHLACVAPAFNSDAALSALWGKGTSAVKSALGTFDAVISIEDTAAPESGEFLPGVVPVAPPSHWGAHYSAALTERKARIFSPRDPTVIAEDSTKRFQDHYAGEPLWHDKLTLRLPNVRAHVIWHVPTAVEAMPMESPAAYTARVTAVIESVDEHVLRFLEGGSKKN